MDIAEVVGISCFATYSYDLSNIQTACYDCLDCFDSNARYTIRGLFMSILTLSTQGVYHGLKGKFHILQVG